MLLERQHTVLPGILQSRCVFLDIVSVEVLFVVLSGSSVLYVLGTAGVPFVVEAAVLWCSVRELLAVPGTPEYMLWR